MNMNPINKTFLTFRHFTKSSLPLRTVSSKLTSSSKDPIDKKETGFTPTNNFRINSFRDKKSPDKSGNFVLSKGDSELNQFILSDKNDPDSFGTLSKDWHLQNTIDAMPDEEEDVEVREFLHNKEGKTRLTTNKYGKIIKEFLKQKKISNALEVLETRMLKDDRVQPENYIYNLLIGACGKVGYTKKAFKLFNQMKKRRLKITGHTYTGLFNACANSPYPDEALKQAQNLRALMVEKAVVMNQTIYHAMIKAFGRCGDLETAFLLVDEMLEKKVVVTDATFAFLLQACITDKTSGFRHALLVWRKMTQRRIRPSLYSFNLLLRCSRDCGLGDTESTQQLIQVLLHSGKTSIKLNHKSEEATKNPEEGDGQLIVPKPIEGPPNLICRQPSMGSLAVVDNITLPEHRLMLMGGAKGILDQMKLFNIKPDIKTFTQLLDQIPSTFAAEKELLDALEQANVPVDVDFCNMLIKKRCVRGDYENAKRVLKLIQEKDLRPDIITFGVLAMACQSLTSAQELLQDIDKVGYRPNVEILGTLVKNACYSRNCDFVMVMMTTLQAEDLKPNNTFLSHLDNFYRFSSKVLSKQTTDNSGNLSQEKFREYCKFYQTWRREMVPDDPTHPWTQFEEPSLEPEDIQLMNYGKVPFAK